MIFSDHDMSKNYIYIGTTMLVNVYYLNRRVIRVSFCSLFGVVRVMIVNRVGVIRVMMVLRYGVVRVIMFKGSRLIEMVMYEIFCGVF